MITVTLYRKPACVECDQVALALNDLQSVVPHQLVVLDVESDPNLNELIDGQVPTVQVGPYKLKHPFSKQDLQVALGAAQDRHQHLERVGDTGYQSRLQRGHTVTGADRFSYWFSNHYMVVFNLFFLIYAGLPFLAPVFMKMGANIPARVIYTIYSPLCHQFAFRSWFLFGEQPAYPRALADVSGLAPYEQTILQNSQDVAFARSFIGNETVGYKVAFCQRDIAIYGSIFLFGLLFALTGRRLKSLPWYFWLLVGIAPIGLDGFSQLPGLSTLPVVAWLPIRESTPLLRTLTGAFFGLTTAWYGYPFVEQTMLETRQLLARKIAVVSHESQPTIRG